MIRCDMRNRIRIFRSADEARPPPLPAALDGFLDALVQKFENCRPGLGEDPATGAEAFFLALYEPERDRLRDVIRLEQAHLPESAHAEMFSQVDRLIRDVIVPAYLRVAVRFTGRERNAFYLAPEGLHGVERIGWAVAGMALGALVIWAPFIPLWSKEWVLPFFLGGLVFPDLRRWWELRRYERDLNELVARGDEEVRRIDVSYVMREPEAAVPAQAAARTIAEGNHGPGRGT